MALRITSTGLRVRGARNDIALPSRGLPKTLAETMLDRIGKDNRALLIEVKAVPEELRAQCPGRNRIIEGNILEAGSGC